MLGSGSSRRGPLLLGAAPVLGAAALFAAAGVAPGSLDDAFITLVYARHLAETGRFYWNAADGTVDGFTSLLDVLVKSLAFRLHPADPLWLSGWIDLVLQLALPVAAMAVVLSRSGETSRRSALAAFGAGLALATSPSLAYAAAFHLEGQLFALLLVCAVGIAASPRSRGFAGRAALPLACCLLVLARPEGVPLALLLLLAGIVRPGPAGVGRRWPEASVFLALLAGYAAWRVWVFGAWAPNTYYAKTSASRWNEIADGLAYLAAFARTADGALVLASGAALPFLLASSAWRDGAARRAAALCLAGLGLSVAGTVVSGGDCYPGARFLLPAVSLVVLVLGVAAASYRGRGAWIPEALLAALVLVQLAALLPDARARAAAALGTRPLAEQDLECHRRVARTLEQLAPDLVVAQTDYQIFKYLSDASRVLDLQGLNDRAIAHRPFPEPVRFGKFDARDGVRADPHVWFYGHRVAMPGCPSLAPFTSRQVLTDPSISETCFGYGAPEDVVRAIDARYVPATLHSCQLTFNFFLRRDLVPRARQLGIRVRAEEATVGPGPGTGGLLRRPGRAPAPRGRAPAD
jgi:hypothetical protein